MVIKLDDLAKRELSPDSSSPTLGNGMEIPPEEASTVVMELIGKLEGPER